MEELKAALASRGLTVSSIEGKGRGLVATRDFAAGDVIIYQEPYASSASKTSGGPVCDGCFFSNNLRKCSACRVAWYCGNMCQKSEWKRMLTPTIRPMMRLLLKRKLQQEQIISTTATDDYRLVEALVSHMSEISEEQLVLYAQMANLVSLVLPLLEVNIKEVTENFSKLACNAHTICDSELQPLGTGLYPVISIVNHSCVPNSVLVFEGHVAYVRAVEHIAKGTEVRCLPLSECSSRQFFLGSWTYVSVGYHMVSAWKVLITYIETAATTKKRQEELKQYFFICNCSRCNKIPYEELKENAILEGYRCKDHKCDGFLLHDSEKKTFTCQHCYATRHQQEIETFVHEVAKISKTASSFLSSGNLSEASTMYKALEQVQLKLCHPLSLGLMRTRDTLLKILMEQQDWKGALVYCKLTIPVYQRVYQINHPMLGLQYYTCGKLEWLLEQTEDALKSFTKAVDILRVTHGTTTQFMKDLISRLEEARAEASYKNLVE